jgi:hypothetical protein
MFPVLSAAPAAKSTNTEEPVFIVGAPRTGSSFLVKALKEAAGFAGFAEGHVTPLMHRLDYLAAGYFREMRQRGLLDIPVNMVANVSEAEFRQALAGVFTVFKDRLSGNRRWLDINRLSGNRRWLDKTVNCEAIGALPYVLSVWPRAKIIYLMRDGIANVISAERYFGVSLREVCFNWTGCGEQWDRTRPELPAGSYVEIRHENLIQHPHRVATQIAEFIGLSPTRLTGFVSFIKAETAKWVSERGVRPRLTDLDWPVERLFLFLSICGEQMCRQGYASKEEIAQALARCPVDRQPIDAARTKILEIDSADYFQLSGDGFFIVPGLERAATAIVAGIETCDPTQFEAELHVEHPNAQPVRFEFIGIDCCTGAIVFHHVEELSALESRWIRVALERRATRIDVLIRVARGISARSNDYAWARINAMCLIRDPST